LGKSCANPVDTTRQTNAIAEITDRFIGVSFKLFDLFMGFYNNLNNLLILQVFSYMFIAF
jgi:hypothetical protein